MSHFAVLRFDEHLSYFTCGDRACGQWWSIAEFGTPPGWSSLTIYCPRCGRNQPILPGWNGDGVAENPDFPLRSGADRPDGSAA